jgi:hypothetical protein
MDILFLLEENEIEIHHRSGQYLGMRQPRGCCAKSCGAKLIFVLIGSVITIVNAARMEYCKNVRKNVSSY